MQDLARKFKEEVAEAAISLFKRNGYNNVTVNEICKECGISRSVFYSSFNGKRSILEYMVEKPQHNDDASFMKFAHADNDFERIWQLFDRFIAIAYDFGPELTSTLFIMQFESPQGIREAVHALDDLFATLAKNCAKSGIIETEEPPELLLSWTPEQLAYMRDTDYWRSIVGQSRGAEVLEVREMESNDEVWADWLRQENEYAIGDRRSMEAGAGKYLNFIKIVLRKK